MSVLQRFGFYRFCFVSVLVLAVTEYSPASAQEKWDAHVDITAKPGNDRKIGKLDLFLPLFQDQNSLGFIDIRSVIADDPSEEGNFGFGIRRIIRNGPMGFDSTIGGYGFFDIQSTENNNIFL